MNQAEKLQFVDVKVADGLHNWEFGDHLQSNRQQENVLERMTFVCHGGCGGGQQLTLVSFSSDIPSFCRQCCSATYTFSWSFWTFWTSVSQGRSEGSNSHNPVVSNVFRLMEKLGSVSFSKIKAIDRLRRHIKLMEL